MAIHCQSEGTVVYRCGIVSRYMRCSNCYVTRVTGGTHAPTHEQASHYPRDIITAVVYTYTYTQVVYITHIAVELVYGRLLIILENAEERKLLSVKRCDNL